MCHKKESVLFVKIGSIGWVFEDHGVVGEQVKEWMSKTAEFWRWLNLIDSRVYPG